MRGVEIVQLLPYHKLGTVKWERLQRNHPILEAEPPKDELVQARKEQLAYGSRNSAPEYQYINYDLNLIKKEYEDISTEIMNLQLALDKYNQTVEFDVEI